MLVYALNSDLYIVCECSCAFLWGCKACVFQKAFTYCVHARVQFVSVQKYVRANVNAGVYDCGCVWV